MSWRLRGSLNPTLTETLGIISDTHGLVRLEAVKALRDCDR